jgi:hypothetical protein
MTAAGFSKEEIWNAVFEARQAGWTRDIGLGQDRLSAAGRAPAPALAAQLEPSDPVKARTAVFSGSVVSTVKPSLQVRFGRAATPGGTVGEFGVRFKHPLSEAFEGVGGFGWFRFGPMLGRPEPEQSG